MSAPKGPQGDPAAGTVPPYLCELGKAARGAAPSMSRQLHGRTEGSDTGVASGSMQAWTWRKPGGQLARQEWASTRGHYKPLDVAPQQRSGVGGRQGPEHNGTRPPSASGGREPDGL